MLHQRPTTHAQSRKSDRRKSVTRKNALAKLHVSTTPHHVVHVLSCKRRVQTRIGGPAPIARKEDVLVVPSS